MLSTIKARHPFLGGRMKKRTIYLSALSIFILILISVATFFIFPTDIQPVASSVSIDSKSSIYIWLSVAILVLSITTTISVLISFYLYKWRKILLSKPNLLVPEEWGKYLKEVSESVDQLNNDQTKAIQSIFHESQDNSEKIQNMIETYMSLQKTLDAKDSEIKRLKNGYDAAIIKKFLYRFIRIDQIINESIEDRNFGPESMNTIRRFFEDALDECGVERFEPTVGDDVRKVDGIAENSKKIVTEIAEDNFRIAEVVSEGYRLTAGDKFDYIVPAKVKVFIHQNKEENK